MKANNTRSALRQWLGGLAIQLVVADVHAGELAVVTRGPYLQLLLAESVEIWWSTDDDVLGGVRYRPEDSESWATIVESEPALAHRVRLDGLAPGTRYVYELLVDGQPLASSPAFRFRTAPTSGTGTVRAAVLGDSGILNDAQVTIGDIVETLDTDLFLHTGDLIYVGTADEAIFEPYRQIFPHTCFYPARGNHDEIFDLRGIPWRELFGVPDDRVEPDGIRERVYYSFDWGPVHFSVLDIYADGEDDSLQSEFLERDLADARARGMPWLVVTLHVPPYTVGAHWDWYSPSRDTLPAICDRFEVDVVLAGHDHNYQATHPIRGHQLRDAWQGTEYVRPRGTIYVVTGGGGARVYPSEPESPDWRRMRRFARFLNVVELEASPEALTLRAHTFGDRILDEITIRKDGERPPFRVLRGDANGDGTLDLTDAVGVLDALFIGRDVPICDAAVRARDDAPISISDAVYLLRFLFAGGPPPRSPFPGCGELPIEEDENCERTAC